LDNSHGENETEEEKRKIFFRIHQIEKIMTVCTVECIALLHKAIFVEENSEKMIIFRKPELVKKPNSHAVTIFE
jgi:hypothetical protein